jgi:hypothetical protein
MKQEGKNDQIPIHVVVQEVGKALKKNSAMTGDGGSI